MSESTRIPASTMGRRHDSPTSREEIACVRFPPLDLESGARARTFMRGHVWTIDGGGEWVRHLMDGVFRPQRLQPSVIDDVVVEQVVIGLRYYLAAPVAIRLLIARPSTDPTFLGLVHPADEVDLRCRNAGRTPIRLSLELHGILYRRCDWTY